MQRPSQYREDYLEAYTLKSWLLTTDHKRIALLYMAVITLFFFIGGAAITVARLELMTPQGDVVSSPDAYNRLFTMHGIIMVWFFLVPAIPTTLGNFLVPMMIGARDLAFPKLNLLSWYIILVAGLFELWVLIYGGVDTGWTFYTPFSSMFSKTMVVPAAVGVFISGFASILTGLNFMVTVHTMRAPGMTWFRLPLFIWSQYANSIIMVLATPVLAITLALIACRAALQRGHLRPGPRRRPDPVSASLLVLFAPRGVHHAAAGNGCRQRDHSLLLAAADLRLSLHRLRQHRHRRPGFSGLGPSHVRLRPVDVRRDDLLVLSFLVAIPSAIKVFNWTATMYKGSIRFDTPMLYVLGFIGLFTMGGLTGLFLAFLAIDVHVARHVLRVAHFHYIMVGGTVMAYLAGSTSGGRRLPAGCIRSCGASSPRWWSSSAST